jgi:hypothetical protein
MVKFSAAMRAENRCIPQYTASAPAAIAARNEFLPPAGARISGRCGSIWGVIIFEIAFKAKCFKGIKGYLAMPLI